MIGGKMKRYYVLSNSIPLRAQPENGYTRLQAIERVQREINNDLKLFGNDLTLEQIKFNYDICDTKNFHIDYDARLAF